MRLRCLLRGKLVAATPEERVRQRLIRALLALGYPRSLMAVEVSIGNGRRADLVVYAPASLEPLVVAECKASEISDSTTSQLFGYNRTLAAPYLVLAAASQVVTAVQEGQEWRLIDGLLPYEEARRLERSRHSP